MADLPASLDELDLRILAALVHGPGRSNAALAAQLAIPASTAAHRVRALRTRGVIGAVTVRVEPAALGLPLQAVVRVRLGRHNEAGVAELLDALAAMPGAIEVFHVAGVDDFLVHLAVEDAEALRDAVLQHITVHEAVLTTETHLVFERREGVGVVARMSAAS